MGPTYPRQIGLSRPSGYHVLLSVLGLPAVMVLITGLQGLVKMVLPDWFEVEESFRMMARWPWYWCVLVVGVAPGIGEELWFRAFMGRGLSGRYGLIGGVLLTSLFFGLVHLDPRHAALAMVMGIVLHLAYLASGSLFVPILLHMLNNTVSILALQSQEPNALEMTAGEISWTVYAASAVLLSAVGWGFYMTRAVRIASPISQQPSADDAGMDLPEVVSAEVGPASVATAPRRPTAVLWVVPLAAACVFAGFAVRETVEFNRRMGNAVPRSPEGVRP
jgi:membrane protease YdiL (CAAX protease family)